MKIRSLVFFILLCVLCSSVLADVVKSGKNKITIRGQVLEVYYFPGNGSGDHRKVLFAPGDGGWRGFAIDIAETMQAAGYDVYGLDTRVYLTSFTGPAVLSPSNIAADMRTLAEWMRSRKNEHILYVGWSEGAGLGLAAAADGGSKDIFAGLVVVGLTEQNILAWRYSDLWAEIAKKVPKEPTFSSSHLISQVSPLPIFMIASQHDEYITPDQSRNLASLAREPKKFVLIDAKDHKYGGNTQTFFQTLRYALTWVADQRR